MEYKKTPIGEIPVDWDLKQVQDVFEIKTGSTPSTKKSEYWENGNIIWVTPADMSKMKEINIKESDRRVTNKALKETNLNLLPKKSIILSTRAPVGYVALNSEEITFNQGCKGLVPKDHNMIDTSFYSYYLLSKRDRLQNLSGGSTFKELAKDTLKRIELPLPPLKEQQKISEILSTTDKAIQKSDDMITKTEHLKKGVLEKLLTKGIGHENFKNTPIGKIPTDWELINLKEILEVEGGYAFKSKDYTKDGIPLIRISNVSFGKVEMKDLVKVPISYVEKYEEYSLKEGDIVMALTRPITGGGIKAGQIKRNHIPSLLNQRVGRLRIIDESIISPNFMFWTIFSDNFMNQMQKGLVTMNQPNISPKQIGQFYVPLPPKMEQNKIAKILLELDKKYIIEQERNLKLQNIKKGIMNDLLTGRKRVEVNN